MEKQVGGVGALLSVDIKCLSIDPCFYPDFTPNDPPFSFSPHPMTSFYYFHIKFYSQIANFCTLCANEKFTCLLSIQIPSPERIGKLSTKKVCLRDSQGHMVPIINPQLIHTRKFNCFPKTITIFMKVQHGFSFKKNRMMQHRTQKLTTKF